MSISIGLSSVTDTSGFSDEDEHLSNDMDMRTPMLFGRSRETSQLLKAYQKVLQTKRSLTVVVHGNSGLGKTCLVNTLREPVFVSGGYFCTGKFSQNSAVQEPHSAFMAAFSDLCDLIAQSDDFEQDRKREIQEMLGLDGYLLTNSITNLSPFVDNSKERELQFDTRNEASVAKFKVACKTFLQAMACERHPVVLFVDDIQWMDDGSRELLRELLQAADLKNVLLIFAYRDEETCGVDDLFRNDEDHVDISLKGLDSGAVHQIVNAAVGSSSERIRELGDLVTHRTMGNPFHVIQFLESIEREGLLSLDAQSSWIFDVNAIQSEMMVANHLADLLSSKIELLNPEVKETLKVASLLGYIFREYILVEVISNVRQQRLPAEATTGLPESFHAAVRMCLDEAVDGGFVELTNKGYQFTHDKLQTAFRSMVDGTEEEHLHLIIGESFLAQVNDDSAIYNAAVHLNSAPAFLRVDAHRMQLARINLEASKYCTQRSAFEMAAEVLREGLGLMDLLEKWSDQYFDLTLEMTKALAKTELIIGNFDACKEATREALSHGNSVEANLDALLINVEVHMVENAMEASIAAANGALRTLGVNMPRRVSTRHVMFKYFKVKRMMKRKNEDLLRLPLMKDRCISTAVRILLHMCMYCFLQDEEDQGVYSALLATELTLKFGKSPYSPNALAIYGISELTLGNYENGYRCGKLALAMLNETKCRDAECPTIGLVLTMLSHWKEPMCELQGPLAKAANDGVAIGDVMYGTYCLAQYAIINATLTGTHLSDQEEAIRANYGRICGLGQKDMLLWVQPPLQYVLILQNHLENDENLTCLTGDIMHEDGYMHHAREANHPILVVITLILKAQLACFFNEFKVAEAVFEKIAKVGHVIRFSFGAVTWYWSAGFAHYNLYRLSGKRKHLRKARKYKKRLERMHSLGSPNAAPYLGVLNAEEASLRRSTSEAMLAKAYDTAIENLSKHKLVHVEGLLNEQAGFAFERLNRGAEAERYFDRAMHLYKDEWGSLAKYEWLKEKRAQQIESPEYASLVGDVIQYTVESSDF